MPSVYGWGQDSPTTWGWGAPGGTDYQFRQEEILTVLDAYRAVWLHLGVSDLSYIIDPVHIVVEKVLGPRESWQFVVEDELEHISFNSAWVRFQNPHARSCDYKVFYEMTSWTNPVDDMQISVVEVQVPKGGGYDFEISGPMNPGAAYRDVQTGQPLLSQIVHHIVEITNMDTDWRHLRVEVAGWAARLTRNPSFQPGPH